MRKEILRRIEREIQAHRKSGKGHIIFKLNSLVDKACIKALYRASMEGVQVELQVRGICCLRPGVDRVSENIRVTSIVGRFLEHVRTYYFHNGGDEEVILGSADLMPRNLDGRVETLFPVEDATLRKELQGILDLHLRDNVQLQQLSSDGSYSRVESDSLETQVDSQNELLRGFGSWQLGESG